MATKFLLKSILISSRLGIAGGAVYYTNQEGLWGTPEQAILFYQKLKEKKTEAGLDLPASYEEKIDAAMEKVTFFSDPAYVPTAEKWNSAVIGAVQFLLTLPDQLKVGKDEAVKKTESLFK